MTKQMKDEYEEAERELSTKPYSVQELQQQIAELKSINRDLHEIKSLDDEIQNLQQGINHIKPEYDRLKEEYERNLRLNQELESKINNVKEQIDKSKKLTSIYDNLLSNLDSILSEYSEFAGQRIDPIKMVVQKLPQSELHHVMTSKLKNNSEDSSLTGLNNETDQI